MSHYSLRSSNPNLGDSAFSKDRGKPKKTPKRKRPPPKEQKEKSKSPENEDVCPICKEIMKEPSNTDACSHRACLKCLKKWLAVGGNCPICRAIPTKSITVNAKRGKKRIVPVPVMELDLRNETSPFTSNLTEAQRTWIQNRIQALEQENQLMRETLTPNEFRSLGPVSPIESFIERLERRLSRVRRNRIGTEPLHLESSSS